jgi:RES domain
MTNKDIQTKHPRIEQFVADADHAYDAIALLQTSAADMPEEILRSYLAALAWECGVSVVFQLPKALEVVRARRLDDKEWPRFKKDLGYPPQHMTRRGRCNQSCQPLLYTALYEDTALAEIGATRGDHCVISTFELPEDLRFVPIGQFDLYRRTGDVYIGAKSQTNTITTRLR